MSVKTDRWIIEQAANGMIAPFQLEAQRNGVVSYGVSSMGYDFRVDDVFMSSRSDVVLDPKKVNLSDYHVQTVARFVLPPRETVWAQSMEYFKIPDDILGVCYGKSTYARCGVLLNMTPIEPGWEGHMTLAISNLGTQPVLIHAYEGIGQIVFYQAEEVPLLTYATKQGKYQAAQGIQAAIMEQRDASSY